MKTFTTLCILLTSLTLIACVPARITRHGHVIPDSAVDQVQPGATQDQVKLVLGTPDTKAALGGDVYYYVSSTQRAVAFMKPEVVERRILAVYFDQTKVVTRVANYSLKDGRVFDLISRETPSQGRELGLLQQLFGNLGKLTPGISQ